MDPSGTLLKKGNKGPPRPGLETLLQLKDFFRLGIFSSAMRRVLARIVGSSSESNAWVLARIGSRFHSSAVLSRECLWIGRKSVRKALAKLHTRLPAGTFEVPLAIVASVANHGIPACACVQVVLDRSNCEVVPRDNDWDTLKPLGQVWRQSAARHLLAWAIHISRQETCGMLC